MNGDVGAALLVAGYRSGEFAMPGIAESDPLSDYAGKSLIPMTSVAAEPQPAPPATSTVHSPAQTVAWTLDDELGEFVRDDTPHARPLVEYLAPAQTGLQPAAADDWLIHDEALRADPAGSDEFDFVEDLPRREEALIEWADLL